MHDWNRLQSLVVAKLNAAMRAVVLAEEGAHSRAVVKDYSCKPCL